MEGTGSAGEEAKGCVQSTPDLGAILAPSPHHACPITVVGNCRVNSGDFENEIVNLGNCCGN